jgi:hypothetical protein
MTSLKGTIQDMWAADPTLTVLHLASRFYTGRVPIIKPTDADPAPPQMPYTRLELPLGARGTRTSSTEYPFQLAKFHVWSETADEADAIVQAIVDCYADTSYSYTANTDTCQVIDTRYDGVTQKQITEPNYTAWESIVTFTLRTMRNRVH